MSTVTPYGLVPDFSKWVEVVPFKEGKKETIVDFSNSVKGLDQAMQFPNLQCTGQWIRRDVQQNLGQPIEEVVCPLEQQILSLRIVIQGLTNDENVKLHFVELEALDKKRPEAQQGLECYEA
ncbi:hypothetical protein ACSBR1_011982 [Camellia fascicularis]